VTPQFRARFGGSEGLRVHRAPGRVNLIGEHTDYNLGFVLPIALDLACFVAAAPSRGGKLRVYSENENDAAEWTPGELRAMTPQRRWTDYVVGVALELMRAGVEVEPRDLFIRSTVPVGSGLSSSASLEVSTALALLAGRPFDKLELAKLCRRAEADFVGMPCGIMDQYISVFGRENAAIRIDCRSLESDAVRLPEGAVILAVNSMVKHELASTAYKQRTIECATAVEIIQRRHTEVKSLRDVTPTILAGVEASLPPVVARRARHVVTEDARVGEFVEASQAGDLGRMGTLFVASHRSLQHDYEVSCAELDFLVETALGIDGVYGARMTGGGFGGCTVNLLRPDAAPQFRERIVRLYSERFGVTPQIYLCRPSAGAGEVGKSENIPPAVQLH
jgi:galactokinase